ncbi:MAG TPA: hypothetical protein VGL65_00900 [Gemmatimonadales bacterium]|jgi:hypothetical protein
MRFVIASLGMLVAAPVAGQATGRLAAGVTYSSSIVVDGTLNTKLRPALAPTISGAVTIPTGKGPFRAILEGTYGRAPLNVTADSLHDQLAAVGTVTTELLAEGPVRGELHWQVGGGAIFYLPSQRQGVFQNGGTHRWIVAAGLSLQHPVTPTMDLLVTARIDSHQFTTGVLQARDYGTEQAVQRLSLLVGVTRRL